MSTLAVGLVLLPVVVGVYAYAAYPLVLWLIAARSKPPRIRADTTMPVVSIVVPAFNEEHQIGGALDALLAQDYPAARMQIVVVSDASTDATDRIVGAYSTRGVELLRMPERGGKTKGENAASALLRGEIVVNTDSSIRLHPAAIRELVMSMQDPGVGVASGRDVSTIAGRHAANATEAGYVGYEMWVRRLETRSGGIVGASGSCYAIRAHLHRIAVRGDLSRDFAAALTARLNGFRAVSVDEAICFVPRTGSLQREFRRKVRTISRGINTLHAHGSLLNPGRHGLFAWKLFSHKICRWLVPVTIPLAVVGLALLAFQNRAALGVFLTGMVFLGLALAGAVWPEGRKLPRMVSSAAFVASANLAVLYALGRFLSRRNDAVWEPTRRDGTATP